MVGGSERGSAEDELIECAAAGRLCDLSARPAEERRVPAGVIVDLCAGGRWPVHARGIQLHGAAIDGAVDLAQAAVPVPLRLTDCDLPFGINLADGSIPLLGLSRCRLGAPLPLGGLRTRLVDLEDSIVEGRVDLYGAVIDGYVDLNGVELRADNDGTVLDLRGIRVERSVLCRKARVNGAVLAMNSVVHGNVEMDGTELNTTDPTSYSLDIRGIRVDGGVFMRHGFVSAGVVTAIAAEIGDLELSDATIRGRNTHHGLALIGIGLQVRGSVLALSPFRCSAGAVWLSRAHIGGDLSLSLSEIDGCDDLGNSLYASGLHVGGGVRLDGLRSAGAVRLSDAVIGGSLSLRDAQLAGDVDEYGNSFAGDGLQVGRSVHLSGSFRTSGEVRLVGASIDGQLSFEGTPEIPLLALRGACCAELADRRASWPPAGNLELRAFRFDALKLDTDWAQRLDWVRRQGFTHWSPNPYEQLAAYYRATGDEDAARRVQIAKHDDELTHLRTTRRWPSLAYRSWRRPLGWLVGYGYRRHRTAWLLAATLVLAGWLFQHAEADGAMVPTEPPAPSADATGTQPSCGDAYPCFNSWIYGADVVLPIIDFGQDTAYRPIETDHSGPWWIWARWALIALGWVLASVFVAAFTGLVQRP